MKMYLGQLKKKNGAYKLEVSTEPKKNWKLWMELKEVEVGYYILLKQLHDDARSASNLPDELNILAEINHIRSQMIEKGAAESVSYTFSEACCDSSLFS